jgi:hypothetical protein
MDLFCYMPTCAWNEGEFGAEMQPAIPNGTQTMRGGLPVPGARSGDETDEDEDHDLLRHAGRRGDVDSEQGEGTVGRR